MLFITPTTIKPTANNPLKDLKTEQDYLAYIETLKHTANIDNRSIGNYAKYNPDFCNWLTLHTANYNLTTFGSKLYSAIYGEPPKCACGNYRVLRSWADGYRVGCNKGNKCLSANSNRSSGVKETLLAKYGVSTVNEVPGVADKRKATMNARFGVDYAAQSPVVIAKQAVTVSKQTAEQKQAKLDKTRDSYIQKFGVDHHMQLVSQQEKVKNTNIAKYGFPFPLQVPIIKAGYKETLAARTDEDIANIYQTKKLSLLKKYGVDTVGKIPLGPVIGNILSDATLFANAITGLTRTEAMKSLGICQRTLSLYDKKYDVRHLYANTTQNIPESEIANFLTSLQVEYEFECRTVITPKELDFYIPEHKVAIEHNGLYWHAEHLNTDLMRHSWKQEQCQLLGIKLLTIFEDEWALKQDICKSKIKAALGKSILVDSTECSIGYVVPEKANNFLKNNHIEGHVLFDIVSIGLYFFDELVSVMSFAKLATTEWELVKYCNVLDIEVVDSAQTLFTHFLSEYQITTVYTLCDLRWENGIIFEKLGFIEGEKVIHYEYTDYKTRFGGIDNESYDRIWDCGQTIWTYTA